MISIISKQSRQALEPTQLPLQWVSVGDFFLGIRWLMHEDEHSPPPSATVKNAWSYTTTLPYALMASWLIKHRDRFTFHIYTTSYFISVLVNPYIRFLFTQLKIYWEQSFLHSCTNSMTKNVCKNISIHFYTNQYYSRRNIHLSPGIISFNIKVDGWPWMETTIRISPCRQLTWLSISQLTSRLEVGQADATHAPAHKHVE